MNFSWNAVKAGVGLFTAFGLSLGILIYFLVSSADPDEDFSFEILAGAFGFFVAMIVSPVLATIVGAIIAKDFDDESDAAFNGGIAGLAGTFVMVVIAILFFVAAMESMEDDSSSSSSSDSDSDDDSDDEFGDLLEFAVKGLLPSGVGGAIGAFAGFRFLWAKMPSSELMSYTHTSAQPMTTEIVNIRCQNCSSQMQVRKLGKSQNVTCESCGTQGEVEV
tara:strand:- start:46 stop:705 length:660 start_codon:yes stop_codon:yes gene_type:complete